MESSENSSWSQIKARVIAAGIPSQQKDVRFWASRKRAASIINAIGKEVETSVSSRPVIAVGDCGVCRHRYLRLGINPAEFSRTSEKIAFGSLYRVIEISKNGGWIKIQMQKGQVGWIEACTHFAISSGEHKVLTSLKRTNTLNFLVNAIASTPL